MTRDIVTWIIVALIFIISIASIIFVEEQTPEEKYYQFLQQQFYTVQVADNNIRRLLKTPQPYQPGSPYIYELAENMSAWPQLRPNLLLQPTPEQFIKERDRFLENVEKCMRLKHEEIDSYINLYYTCEFEFYLYLQYVNSHLN